MANRLFPYTPELKPFQEADDAWSLELQRVFGKNAGQARYEARGKGEEPDLEGKTPMPEFILDHGSPEAAKQFRELDSFTQGYIEAMFFTSTGTGDDAELEHATFAELAPETLAGIVADCREFQDQHSDDLQEAFDNGQYGERGGYDETAAGRDFWYTRCGHGVGFWDSGLGDVGDALTAACRNYHSRDLYRGSDGLLYLA